MSKRYDFNEAAPEGQVYVCGACGKTSQSRSGFDHDGNRTTSSRWDESCFLNAVLCEAGGPPWKAVTR